MDKSRLVAEKARLDVERTKLARLSNQGDMEEETKEIETSKLRDSANRFDFIFKIVIIGDAVCSYLDNEEHVTNHALIFLDLWEDIPDEKIRRCRVPLPNPDNYWGGL